MPILDRENCGAESFSQFCEETRADRVAELFPNLRDTFDALQEIREFNRDMSRTTSMTRRFARNGVVGRQIACIPPEIALYWKKNFGFLLTQNRKMFDTWLAQHPEYKTN